MADGRTTTALVLDKSGELSLTDVTLADPGPGEVLVRIEASGVCHSDLHMRDGDWPIEYPIVLGHEGAGVVEHVGAGVTSVAEGDHVVLAWVAPCGRCTACSAGRAWACANHRVEENLLPDGTSRFSIDGTEVKQMFGLGTFSRRTVVAESSVVKIPREVPFDVASLIGCGVATGAGSVNNLAKVRPGEAVAVIGCGGVGLSVVLAAAAFGAYPIIAIDLEAEKTELACQLGATHAVAAGDNEATAAAVESIIAGGVDHAFDVVGIDATVDLMVSILKVAGTGVVVGVAASTPRVPFDPIKGLTLIGSNYGGCTPVIDFPRLAQLYLTKKLDVASLISDRIALDDVDNALASLRNRTGSRSVVLFEGEH